MYCEKFKVNGCELMKEEFEKNAEVFEKEYYMFAIKVGLKIGYYRRVADMTQQELADATGLSHVYIGQLEGKSSNNSPSLKSLLKISRALGVKPHKFIDVDDDD